MGGRVGASHYSHHFNSQLLMTDVGWGRVGPPHCPCHFNFITADGGVGGRVSPPHCSRHFNSQLLIGGWGLRWSSSLLISPTKLNAAQQ